MATVIKSMNDLTKILESRIQQALKITQQEIFETIQRYINDYYHEYTPELYQRTWKLLNSLIKTEIIKVDNGFSCNVQIDKNYLSYKYKGGATGLDVTTYANQHSHGGVYDDDFGQFWNDAMGELGLELGIKSIMKKNLKKCGISIK